MSSITPQQIDSTNPSVVELRRRLDIYMAESHRQDDFINQRMTWFVMSQSFLAIADAAAGQQGNSIWQMTILIPLVGIVFALFARVSIRNALDYQEMVVKKKDELITQFVKNHDYDEEQIAIVIEPWGLGSQDFRKFNSASLKAVPLILAVFWIVVLAIAFNVYVV